jgi:hypothetical protein
VKGIQYSALEGLQGSTGDTVFSTTGVTGEHRRYSIQYYRGYSEVQGYSSQHYKGYRGDHIHPSLEMVGWVSSGDSPPQRILVCHKVHVFSDKNPACVNILTHSMCECRGEHIEPLVGMVGWVTTQP